MKKPPTRRKKKYIVRYVMRRGPNKGKTRIYTYNYDRRRYAKK